MAVFIDRKFAAWFHQQKLIETLHCLGKLPFQTQYFMDGSYPKGLQGKARLSR